MHEVTVIWLVSSNADRQAQGQSDSRSAPAVFEEDEDGGCGSGVASSGGEEEEVERRRVAVRVLEEVPVGTRAQDKTIDGEASTHLETTAGGRDRWKGASGSHRVFWQ
ncbi:hypothetical protein CMUS01_05961 [Colletotrichum musicola]|uniref:Uncharacterized protein n=1 Tax=Colletotrichum musicola TaxID=2175873 RepID=A0A8H6KNY7_9PEZI|nr:hypothetical protein CMUS01_05961 [Colletotrichum musicola]